MKSTSVTAAPQPGAIPATIVTAIQSFERSIASWMHLPLRELGRLSEKDRDLLQQIVKIETVRLKGGSPVEIGKQMALVRETLNAEAPSENASRVYLRLLSQVPADLLGIMSRNLLMSYKYPGYPKPADFLAAVHEETQARRDRMVQALILQNRLAVYDLYYG